MCLLAVMVFYQERLVDTLQYHCIHFTLINLSLNFWVFVILQVPLDHWQKCVEKMEEKILCAGSGKHR